MTTAAAQTRRRRTGKERPRRSGVRPSVAAHGTSNVPSWRIPVCDSQSQASVVIQMPPRFCASHASIELGGSARSGAQILLNAVPEILGGAVRFAVPPRLAAGEPLLVPITFSGGSLAPRRHLTPLDPNPEIATTRLFFSAIVLEAILAACWDRLGRALVARGALRLVRTPVAAC